MRRCAHAETTGRPFRPSFCLLIGGTTFHCGKAPANAEKAAHPAPEAPASAEATNTPPGHQVETSNNPCEGSETGHVIELTPERFRVQGNDILRGRDAPGSLRIPALMERVESRKGSLQETALQHREEAGDVPPPDPKAACVRIEGTVTYEEVTAVAFTPAMSEMERIALTLHRGDSPPTVQLPAIPIHLPVIGPPRSQRAAAEEAPPANAKLLLSGDTFRSFVGQESTAGQPFEGEAITQTLRTLHARAKDIDGPSSNPPLTLGADPNAPFSKVYGVLLLATELEPPPTLAQEAVYSLWTAVFPRGLNPQQPSPPLFSRVTLFLASSDSEPAEGSAAQEEEKRAPSGLGLMGDQNVLKDSLDTGDSDGIGEVGRPSSREEAIDEQPTEGSNVLRVMGTGGPPAGRASGF